MSCLHLLNEHNKLLFLVSTGVFLQAEAIYCTHSRLSVPASHFHNNVWKYGQITAHKYTASCFWRLSNFLNVCVHGDEGTREVHWWVYWCLWLRGRRDVRLRDTRDSLGDTFTAGLSLNIRRSIQKSPDLYFKQQERSTKNIPTKSQHILDYFLLPRLINKTFHVFIILLAAGEHFCWKQPLISCLKDGRLCAASWARYSGLLNTHTC